MKTIVIIAFFCLRYGYTGEERKFPRDFLFGAASSAYQTEGAWADDDKGESIWDHLTHTSPWAIRDKTNGDITTDSYHNYKRDVEMMRLLGLNAYRFSISWTRILPTGFDNEVSQIGVKFYNNLINELLKYRITPIVTLYHFDLPQKLQEFGGFVNPQIADWFEDYARIVFKKFGDRVKHWITFSDPNDICDAGYSGTTMAPQLNAGSIAKYNCAKNLLIAHASAYHVYKNEFKDKQGGVVGISIGVTWFVPLSDIQNDTFACELVRQYEWGLYADPIFSAEGGFPKELSERVAEKSREQGYSTSRLPDFSDEEKAFVKGTYDFFGLNHYTAVIISASLHKVPADDILSDSYTPVYWPQSASSWLKQAPNSLYNVLVYLKSRYSDPFFIITANGWSTMASAGLQDDDRVGYLTAALDNVLDSLESGVRVKGYMHWSLMDSFEWTSGLTERFGLFAVDFEDVSRPRTPRKSAAVYKHIIKSQAIDPTYQPHSLSLIIDKGH